MKKQLIVPLTFYMISTAYSDKSTFGAAWINDKKAYLIQRYTKNGRFYFGYFTFDVNMQQYMFTIGEKPNLSISKLEELTKFLKYLQRQFPKLTKSE